MANKLTRSEVEEQFGHMVLDYQFFCGNNFVFSKQGPLGHYVTMFVDKDSMNYVGSESSALVAETLRRVGNTTHFLIMNGNLEIIYED